jgi:hypothetical protein
MPVKHGKKEAGYRPFAFSFPAPHTPLRLFYFIDLYSRNKTTYGLQPLSFTARNTNEGEFLPLGCRQELHVPLPPPISPFCHEDDCHSNLLGFNSQLLLSSSLVCPGGLLTRYTILVSSRIRIHKRGSNFKERKI